MAYATYTTEALVCGTKDRNTADRSFQLFTKEAGMLFADARSVRKETSRQRYALQDFSLVRVSLVKGKHGWKIGSVASLKNYYHLAETREARGSVVEICRLLRRFVRGEAEQERLFELITSALDVLVGKVKHRNFLVRAVALKVLAALGYVDQTQMPDSVRALAPKDLSGAFTEEVSVLVEKLYTHAVSVSHL